MSYIVGTSLPNHKTLIYSLTYVYGVGLYTSKSICKKAGLGLDCKMNDISSRQVLVLETLIESSNVMVGSALQRFNNDRIRHLCEIVSYRGFRHRKGLPVRGQRTHTNSKRRSIFEWKKVI